jgi:hypothetical protein
MIQLIDFGQTGVGFRRCPTNHEDLTIGLLNLAIVDRHSQNSMESGRCALKIE